MTEAVIMLMAIAIILFFEMIDKKVYYYSFITCLVVVALMKIFGLL